MPSKSKTRTKQSNSRPAVSFGRRNFIVSLSLIAVIALGSAYLGVKNVGSSNALTLPVTYYYIQNTPNCYGGRCQERLDVHRDYGNYTVRAYALCESGSYHWYAYGGWHQGDNTTSYAQCTGGHIYNAGFDIQPNNLLRRGCWAKGTTILSGRCS